MGFISEVLKDKLPNPVFNERCKQYICGDVHALVE